MTRWPFLATVSRWATVPSQAGSSTIHTVLSTVLTCSYPLMSSSPAAHQDQRLSNTESSCSRKNSETPRCILRVEPFPREGRQSHQDLERELSHRHQRRNDGTSLTNKCHSRSREDCRRSALPPRQTRL